MSLTFEDAIQLRQTSGKKWNFSCPFQVSGLTLKGVNSDTIRAYHLIKNKNANEVFITAYENNDTNTVRALLKVGINPDIPNHLGDNALLSAAYHNNFEMAKLLIDHGANVNFVSDEFTPLTVASMESSPEIVQLLLLNGADINVVSWGKTAYQYAATFKNYDVLHVLKAYEGKY